MRKIPTLFQRVFEDHNVKITTDKITPGLEWVLNGEGKATLKFDGSCCAIINGEFYKRYDAKKGKKPPEGAIPCCDPDPVTGHWPHWVKVDKNNPADKWFVAAFEYSKSYPTFPLVDGTYEAVGKHFNGNPYNVKHDRIVRHGNMVLDVVDRTFEGIRDYLEKNEIEGIVFWKDGEPQCKIKRSDFGFPWPVRK